MRISQNRSGTASYYGYDGHGSVRHLFGGTGAVTDAYQYDAFGELISRVGISLNPYMFAGEQYDVSLNLYYLRARWYNQRTGRFLTQDAVEGFEMKPSTSKLYIYGLVDPVVNVDPSGNSAGLETALLDADAIKKWLIFTATLSGVGLTCYLACEDNRGRWQAQGSDMAHSGIGARQTWFLPQPPWKVMGILQLTALMSTLTNKQRENRMDAYAKAIKWVSQIVGGVGTSAGRSFPAVERSGMQQYWQRRGIRQCPDGDCRIDVEITVGRAFIF